VSFDSHFKFYRVPPRLAVVKSRRVQVISKQSWAREDILRVLNITARQLQSWEKQELIPKLKTYAFGEMVALRTLAKMREGRVPAERIRRSVASLRAKLKGIDNPLTELKVFIDGKRIGVQLAGQKMDSISGQLLLDFDANEIKRMLSFPTAPSAATAAKASRTLRAEGEHWFQKGLELEQAGVPRDEIIAAYKKAIELDPASAGALVNLGTIYFHARDWTKAEKYYQQAVESDPSYALAHFNLGNLYDERNERQKARSHYEEALRLRDNYADAHYNLALLHQADGHFMKAVMHWKTYLKLDPASNWSAIAKRELEKLRRVTVVEGSRPAPKETRRF
jgi:tetratricopeptide (TPR) repeat protein